MSALLVALILSAVICGGVLWRRPDARAAAGGAWSAGKAQAVQEFRSGYQYAQTRLLASNPRRRNPRRWISWGLAGAYGTAQAIAAANRIRGRAWQGARDRHAEWKAAQPIDAEVVAEVVKDSEKPNETTTPEPADDQAITATAQCANCGATHTVTLPPGTNAHVVRCGCGMDIHFFRKFQAVPGEPSTEQTSSGDTTTPGADQAPQTEGTNVQTEAAGLTSYAAAHTELADELRTRMSGSENLAASMSDVLAEHSDVIGMSAVLQDHLNQAAAIAQQIADRSLAVANN